VELFLQYLLTTRPIDKLRTEMKQIQLIIFSTLLAGAAFAQTPTPTSTPVATATGTATPTACESLQVCVDHDVTSALSSCSTSNPTCTFKTADKFAVSAKQVARRAIDNNRCTKKTKRGACNVCYNISKIPLTIRFKGDIFHGLLAHATTLIEQERKSFCTSLPAGFF
jgi:hypothetical protein